VHNTCAVTPPHRETFNHTHIYTKSQNAKIGRLCAVFTGEAILHLGWKKNLRLLILDMLELSYRYQIYNHSCSSLIQFKKRSKSIIITRESAYLV